MSGASDTDDEVQGELADFADPERFGPPAHYAEPIAPPLRADDDDPDQGYDRSDPKHPDWHGTMSDLWDGRDR